VAVLRTGVFIQAAREHGVLEQGGQLLAALAEPDQLPNPISLVSITAIYRPRAGA
jgi:hypothetical protein